MRNYVGAGFALSLLLLLLNALGAIPPQLAAAAGVLGEDAQAYITEWVGTERVYLQQADQAIADARRQEQSLMQEVATQRVDHELALARLDQVQGEEIAVRAGLAQVGQMLEANQTVTLKNGDVWSPTRIREYVTREVARHKLLVEQVAIFEETVQLYAANAAQAEAALVTLRQDLRNVQSQRELLAALVAQGSLINRQAQRPSLTADTLTQSRQDIQSLIDSQRRANRIAQEMAGLAVPETATPLMDEGDAELMNYIRDVTGIAAGR